jgi:RING finger protein 113A
LKGKGIIASLGEKRKLTENSIMPIYESSREILPQSYAGDATHTTEIDTAIEKDARTILERNIKLNNEGILDSEPNIYHGANAYKSFLKKDMSQVGANKFTGYQLLHLCTKIFFC